MVLFHSNFPLNGRFSANTSQVQTQTRILRSWRFRTSFGLHPMGIHETLSISVVATFLHPPLEQVAGEISAASCRGNIPGLSHWICRARFQRQVEVEKRSRRFLLLKLSMNVMHMGVSCMRCWSRSLEVNGRHITGTLNVKLWDGIIIINHRIPAPFGYMPCIRPPPLPPLRQLAYQDGVSLVGPTVDLESWYRCGPVKVEGKLFNNHPSDVACSVGSPHYIFQKFRVLTVCHT
jgi:hypothetical protein